MKPMRFIVPMLVLGALAQPALAFQETNSGGSQEPAATSGMTGQTDKPAVEAGKKGLNLTLPEVSLGKGTGTEVRIPGLGTVGVLPKLDFGLELLYGANEAKSGLADEKLDSNDVQIRGTIKHRF